MVTRLLLAVASLSLVLGHDASAKVGPTDLTSLATSSDVIAAVNVVRVHSKKGARIAEASVSRIVKGPSDLKTLYFVASPTWTCDISTAEEGENALVFLRKIKDRSSVSGRDFGYDWELPTEGYDPLHKIAHSGRGRMPIREKDGVKYAEVWVGDVRLPQGLKTHPGRRPEYSFIRDVRVDEIIRELEKIVKKQREQGAAADPVKPLPVKLRHGTGRGHEAR